ncbi:hypothetical protein KIH74_19770 [Kineosporia sp. J2-2]|uniref:Uncharacterized protein n=1 Tax=Kineosporia corallincola TaxID=2835133 RepID=A0ABS5TNM8_9ACTN|nr:hypothetical protein [Kineosporia corallincola]MBT0771189.1 hypothetical protein [Kineosporia corallincola]
MGFLDRLLGRDKQQGYQQGYQQQGYQQNWGGQQQQPAWGSPTGRPGGYPQPSRPGAEPGSDAQADQAAIARYRYMLKTAPPERIEEAHAEAFAKLSPDQRRQVLAELSSEVPPAERARTDSPRDLARMATRAEMRSPGTLERSFGRGGGMSGGMGGMGGGMGMGGMLAGGLLAGVAGAFVGTAIADAMFDGFDESEFQEGYEAAADDFTQQAENGQAELEEAGGDFGDFGGGDFGGGEFEM